MTPIPPPWKHFNKRNDVTKTIDIRLFSCCTCPCCDFFLLYSFHVAPFCVLQSFHLAPFLVVLHVALISRCTFFVLYSSRVTVFPSCTFYMFFSYCTFFSSCTFFELHSFRIAPFFAWHSFDIVLHLFSWCTVVLFSCFIFFVLLHIGPCCILLQCCSSFKLNYFHALFFSYYSVFIMSFFRGPLFMSRHFSCFNVFMLYLMCTLFILHLFSCLALFMSHLFSVWTFTFDLFCFTLFMVSLFAAAFALTAHVSHYTLPYRSRFMSYLFSLVLFSFGTFFIIHCPMAILHAVVISCCCLLRLHFFILRFFHVALFLFLCIFFLLHFFRLYYLLAIVSETFYNIVLFWV